MRVPAIVVAACAIGAAGCGGGGRGGPPPVLAPSGPRLPPPPPIDPGVRGAAYLAAVAAHIQPAWGQFLEDCRLRLPARHPLNVPALAATADLAIARDGSVAALHLVEASGNADFDAAVRGVLGDAAPLPRPPSDLESDDERVHVRWLLARDRRQAGPATARVMTVELPLPGVVEKLLEKGAIARAAHRTATGTASEPERAAAAERVMIAVLREGLASADGGVRRAAVEAVGRARVQALAGEVHLLLVSAVDVDLELAAIAASSALGDPAAAPAILADYRTDLASRPRVALEKTAALVALGRAADAAAAIRAELEGEGGPGGAALAALALAPIPELAPRLAAWFGRGDARVRASVCTALPAAAPAQAAQLVERGLRDPDATVRATCADAAGRRAAAAPPDAGIGRRLEELVRDRDRTVRARALAALARLSPGLRPRGLRVLDDPAAEVRAAGAAAATDAELRALAGDRDADVRAAALAGLGGRDPELALRAASDGAAQVRRAAAAALADDAALERLAHDDSPEVATAAQLRLAARRGHPAVTVPFLRADRRRPDRRSRARADRTRVVAGPLAVRHHSAMGLVPRATALLATTALVGTSLAGERTGRVVRVEAPKRIEVFVPAGKFLMGVDPDTASAASAQCEVVFSPMMTGYTGGNPPVRVNFCEDYSDTLAAMQPRDVYLDAYRDRSRRGHRRRLPPVRRRRRVRARSADRRRRALHPRRLADGQRHLGRGAGLLPLARRRGSRPRPSGSARRAATIPSATWPWGERRAAPGLQPRSAARRRRCARSSASPRRRRSSSSAIPTTATAPRCSRRRAATCGARARTARAIRPATSPSGPPTPASHDDKVRGYAGLSPRPTRCATRARAASRRVVRGGSWRQPIVRRDVEPARSRSTGCTSRPDASRTSAFAARAALR